MKKVAIIGVGLMGGSLGLALRKVLINGKREYEIIGIGRHIESLQLAKDKGAVDSYYTDFSALKDIDIAIICTPVDTIVNIYKKISQFVSSKTIVSDIGSVKFNIDNQIQKLRKIDNTLPDFVGCHPMAGTEQQGVSFADVNLYKNATVIITAQEKTENVKIIENLWEVVGCKVLFITSKQHDEYVAFTSHLPHVISYSFYKMFLEKSAKDCNIKNITAGSFNSITRVAKSSPQMWIPIFLNNKENLKKLADEFCNNVKQFIESMDDEEKLKQILDKSVNNENK